MRMKKRKHLALLVKPVSGLCNMRCSYCFYADEIGRRHGSVPSVMTEETAAALISSAFDSVSDGGSLSFSFQGGEPSLAGLDFFRFFCDRADRMNTRGLTVSWAIQTNGLAVDDEWAAFLKDRRFLAGVSVDGDYGTHNAFRADAAGRETFDRVQSGLQCLLRAGTETNLLCVVHARTAGAPKKVYRALKDTGIRWLQFIPCLDPLDGSRGSSPWSLTAEAYGRFLCAVFDCWYQDWLDGRRISVQPFEDWVLAAMGRPGSTCASCGNCGAYLVAEADGSLYPCDFYALDEWKLGTVSDGITAAFDSERMKSFAARSAVRPPECRCCPWAGLCRGGCPRYWVVHEKEPGNVLCPALQRFFSYASDRIRLIARYSRQVPQRSPG